MLSWLLVLSHSALIQTWDSDPFLDLLQTSQRGNYCHSCLCSFVYSFIQSSPGGLSLVAHRGNWLDKTSVSISIFPLSHFLTPLSAFLRLFLKWITCTQIFTSKFASEVTQTKAVGKISPLDLATSVKMESPKGTCDHALVLPEREQGLPQNI